MKTVSTNLLESFIEWLNTLPERELARLNNGQANVVFAVHEKKTISKAKATGSSADSAAVIASLNLETSREAGQMILDKEGIDKAVLIAICKRLDLPASSKDNMASLKERIIEQTIGYRLRSQAIRGT